MTFLFTYTVKMFITLLNIARNRYVLGNIKYKFICRLWNLGIQHIFNHNTYKFGVAIVINWKKVIINDQ